MFPRIVASRDALDASRDSREAASRGGWGAAERGGRAKEEEEEEEEETALLLHGASQVSGEMERGRDGREGGVGDRESCECRWRGGKYQKGEVAHAPDRDLVQLRRCLNVHVNLVVRISSSRAARVGSDLANNPFEIRHLFVRWRFLL